MRSFSVVKVKIVLNYLFSMFKIFKDMHIDTFIFAFSVKAFKISIFPGTGFRDKLMFYSVFSEEFLEDRAFKFRPLICSYDFGNAIFFETRFQDKGYFLSSNTEIRINRNNKSGIDIFNNQTFERFSIFKRRESKINSPYMIFEFRDSKRLSRGYFLGSVSFIFLSLEIKKFVDTINSFMIYMDIHGFKCFMNSSIAKEGEFISNFLDQKEKSIFFMSLFREVVDRTNRDIHKLRDSFCFNASFNHFSSNFLSLVFSYKFFLMISLSTCISNSFSASSLLSLRFSSSRILSFLASEEESPLYFCFHLSKVLLAMEYFLQTLAMELPGSSASARICIILSGGYFVGFITIPPFSKILHKITLFDIPKNGGQVRCILKKRMFRFKLG